jgi:pyruvate,water dikinase
MLRKAGAVTKNDNVPPYSCAFSTRGHLFINLSTIYRMENAAFLTSKDQVNFSICGRILQEEGLIPGKKAWFLRKLVNTFKYLGFILSRNKARKKLALIADNFVIDRGQTGTHELYNAIDAAMDTLNYVAYLHYVTSAHSGAMSSSFLQVLQKKLPDIEKCKTVLTEILERIDGIESVDILVSLRRTAKAVLEENPQAVLYDTQQLAVFLKTAGEKVKAEYNNFLTRHGHRAIREAELRNKGWAEDEAAFTEYLKTVISGNTEKEKKPAPDFKAVLEAYGFKGGELKALIYLAKEAREGVKNREYSKSKLIKVLDGFKKAYTRLAVKLTEQGRLPDQDAVFFLTHQEIGELVKNENAALVKKAIQRRRLLKSQSELRFNEIYTDKPEPLPVPELTGTGALHGTPISRGIATGPARVVRSAEDAALLQKGEIMVAVFTDIGWSPFYCLIEGLVTEIGGVLSHGAVVAREYALPFVSNIPGITSIIRTGDIITVNGSTGCVTKE